MNANDLIVRFQRGRTMIYREEEDEGCGIVFRGIENEAIKQYVITRIEAEYVPVHEKYQADLAAWRAGEDISPHPAKNEAAFILVSIQDGCTKIARER